MKKICIITGSRSDYGLIYWLLKEIESDPDLKLQLVVTAMHLIPEFGNTQKEIENDGFTISKNVPFDLSDDSNIGLTASYGRATALFGKVFEELKPDVLVLQGDRLEMLAAASAALITRLPIAHLHGGESTYGAMDDAIRHAITKMATLHFPATEVYRQRILRMGESPNRVFCVGALGLEHLKRTPLLSKKELETSLEFEITNPTLLATFHPVTLEKQTSQEQMTELLGAFDQFPKTKIIFTYPNADPDNQVIREMIENYTRKNPKRAVCFASLGQLRYLSCLQYVDAVIGNSSSGIIEVPAFGKPTVNIGDRQKGRLMAPSIIQCEAKTNSISDALKKAFDPSFAKSLSLKNNPYKADQTSTKIKNILKETDFNPTLLKKKFYEPL